MGKRVAPFLILLAAILWGTTGTARSFAPDSAHPIAIGAVRLAIGGMFLLVIVALQGKINFKNLLILPTFIAALCMALFQPFFFTAVAKAGVAIGTVVAIGSAPIFAGLIEWIVLKIRPAKVWWYSTILAIVGCQMLFIHKDSVPIDPLGIVMALGAGLSFASYTLLNRSLVVHHPPLSVVAIVFSISALYLSPFLFIFDLSWLGAVEGIVVSLHLGIMATGIAYLFFTKGLVHVPPSTAVTLSLAEPLTATLLGVFLLGEKLTITSWFGIFLLLLGIGILIRAESKAVKSEHP